LARDYHCEEVFPEFGQFCIAGFPASTQVFLKSLLFAVLEGHAALDARLEDPTLKIDKRRFYTD
jgi:hypothetical protein